MAVERDGVYAGADLANAHRFNTLVWVLWAGMLVVLAVAAPPTAHGAVVGWAVFAANLGVAVAAALTVRRLGFAGLMGWCYAATMALAALTWAAGGLSAPYDEMALGLVVCTALTHPLVIAVPFYLIAALLRLAPVAYGQADGRLADVLTAVVLWGMVVVVGGQVMETVRGHRHTLATRGDSAIDDARRDSLTGLETRRAFTADLPDRLAASRTADAPLAVIVMDVDWFKDVNDTYGHLEGDRALQAVAQGIRSGTRPGDWLVRWGGDEFVVVLEGVDEGLVTAVCNRMAARITAVTEGEPWGPISVTAGWAIDDGESSAEWLLDAADTQLLAEKGRRHARSAR